MNEAPTAVSSGAASSPGYALDYVPRPLKARVRAIIEEEAYYA